MNLQEAKNFLGIELKDRSVRVLFKKCIPSEGTHSVESALLFTRAFGYHKDQDPVFFDTDKLKENKEYILFLIGQLRESHNPESNILKIEDAVFRYDGTIWTNDKETMMKLLYLGVAPSIQAISPLKYPDHFAWKDMKLLSTLAPSDPNYYSWLKEYKRILISKLVGQESADD